MKNTYNSAELVIIADLFNRWLDKTSNELEMDKDDLQEIIKIFLMG